jgi:hypothetical protein
MLSDIAQTDLVLVAAQNLSFSRSTIPDGG